MASLRHKRYGGVYRIEDAPQINREDLACLGMVAGGAAGACRYSGIGDHEIEWLAYIASLYPVNQLSGVGNIADLVADASAFLPRPLCAPPSRSRAVSAMQRKMDAGRSIEFGSGPRLSRWMRL